MLETDANSGWPPPEEYQLTPEEERKAEIWAYALDYIYRVGRQVRDLRARGYTDEALKVLEAGSQFIDNFGYGATGRDTLSVVFQMGRVDETIKASWLEARGWPRS